MLQGKFRQKLGVDNDTLLVGIIGRLAPIKNHKMFFDAAKKFIEHNKNTPVVFAIIGDGEMREKLEAYCQKQGLTGQVIFYGWEKNVASVYADLDILALTSLSEGTPVSIIEAMASSVPVIATDAGGVIELLGDPVGDTHTNGFKICERGVLCRKNDATGFSAGLKWLIENKGFDTKKLTDQARSFAKEHFSSERLVNDIEKLYLELYNSKCNINQEKRP
ncbi:MAG: glycosyltransferase [Pseudomonadota bacterium]